VSCNVESGEKLINKDEADDTCTRPHSGIKLYVINAVNEDNTEEENCDGKIKPTMKRPQMTMRRPALEVVVSLCPPPTIARVALILG